MKTTHDCAEMRENLCDYLEDSLAPTAKTNLEAHLESCASCRRSLDQMLKIENLLQQTVAARGLSADFNDVAGRRLKAVSSVPLAFLDSERPIDEPERVAFWATLGGVPWWGVSLALHALVIALAGLISMAIKMPPGDDVIVMITELTPRPQIETPPEEKKSESRDVLSSKHETPPTDPTSNEQNDVVVPPEVLARAQLGDHFETLNPDRPDTQSAFGNPEAKMFHSDKGSDEAEGGGGNLGASLDDLVGVGGNASPGSGGGWGGGHGTGNGVGSGSGSGSFGARSGGGRRVMVKRHGGNKATEDAVDKALEWLAKHQEADGHWDYAKYEEGSHAVADRHNADVGITGAALLAFLGAGHTERIGNYKDNVRRGMEWLIKDLGEKKRFADVHASNYAQGIAAMAMAEAAGMSPRNAAYKKAAQQAIDGVTEGQIKDGPSEYQAWDYAPHGLTNDTSVTGWNILALKSAKVAGLHVDFASVQGAMRWINAAQDLANVKDGDGEYFEGGMVAYRGTLKAPGAGWISVTAIGAATRLFVGGERPSHPGVSGPCNLMLKNLPNKGNDLYYWYYATLTMFQKGGDHWQKWNKELKPYLCNTQRKDGDFDGSFDPSIAAVNGVKIGGRVFSTALGALCLEVYYRYAKLNP